MLIIMHKVILNASNYLYGSDSIRNEEPESPPPVRTHPFSKAIEGGTPGGA
jgi:hypothetical protein